MNDNDRLQMEALKLQIDALKMQMTEIANNVNRLTNAMLGDADAGSIGLVMRIARIESKLAECEKRVEALEDTKKQIYAGAAVISALISMLSGIIFTIIKMVR